MTKALLRKQAHGYVDKADEKTLRMVNAMLSEALLIEQDHGTLLTPDQIKELDRRVKLYEAGKLKMIPWEKVKKRILKKHKLKSK